MRAKLQGKGSTSLESVLSRNTTGKGLTREIIFA